MKFIRYLFVTTRDEYYKKKIIKDVYEKYKIRRR